MALVTIVFGAVRDLREIEAMTTKARRDLRNVIDRQRRVSLRWQPFELLGWLEVDSVPAEDIVHLGPDKRRQIEECVSVFEGDTGPIWVPTMHAIVRFGEHLDADRVRAAFEHQWPGHRRIDVRAFCSKKTVETNLGNITNYALKHECSTEYYDLETGEVLTKEWGFADIGMYHEWLHGWSRGFQSLKFSVSPKTSKSKKSKNNIEVEPMCMIHSISEFHTDYYYWSRL